MPDPHEQRRGPPTLAHMQRVWPASKPSVLEGPEHLLRCGPHTRRPHLIGAAFTWPAYWVLTLSHSTARKGASHKRQVRRTLPDSLTTLRPNRNIDPACCNREQNNGSDQGHVIPSSRPSIPMTRACVHAVSDPMRRHATTAHQTLPGPFLDTQAPVFQAACRTGHHASLV